MSKPLSKKSKTFLVILSAIVLISGCFGLLAIYAKKELHKPKFQVPEEEKAPHAASLLEDKAEAFDYVEGMFNDIIDADDVEGSLGVRADLSGDAALPFTEADNEIISFIRNNSGDKISAMFETYGNTRMNELKDKPELSFSESDIIDFSVNQDGDDFLISFTVNPERIDTAAINNGKVTADVIKELSPYVTVDTYEISAKEFTVTAKISGIFDRLVSIEKTEVLSVDASVILSDDLKKINNGNESADVTLPCKVTKTYSFFDYGLKFTQDNIVVNPKDMKALPMAINVNSETTKDEYTLSFDVSKDGLLEIDKDGVMTVLNVPDDTVTVTATLDYDGHTYTDSLLVYITQLEVATNVPE